MESSPWDFSPPQAVFTRLASSKKPARTAIIAADGWDVYSSVGASSISHRISKDNPASTIRGFVADYDAPTTVEAVVQLLGGVRPEFIPNFIEQSLSRNIRLVWVFERELMAPSAAFAREFMQAFAEKLALPTLLAGYDTRSADPGQVWANGARWFNVKPEPMSWEVVFGIACSVSKKTSLFGSQEVNLSDVADEVNARWPGRWRGEFAIDNLGIRFWDVDADNPAGCQIKPDGLLCFTGRQPFVTWEELLGREWVEEHKVLRLGSAAGEIYFDGRGYWENMRTRWNTLSREDCRLALRTRGLNDKVPRGGTASEVERVLRHIQEENRVDGAVSLINYRPGIVELNGQRFLNITTMRPMTPVGGNWVPETDFPFLWSFMQGHFARPEDRPLEHFLAWLQRFYKSISTYVPLMGHAVFLCGPKNCGKTLLCNRIIAPLVGSAIADPFPYFVGETAFNGDLFNAALLAVNDQDSPRDESERRKLQARVKSFVVNPIHDVNEKFREKKMVSWTGRIFFSLNDDPASVGMLPEVSDGTADKMMFFASQPYAGSWGSNQEIESILSAELPKFAHWLLNIHQPGAGILVGGRTGVASFYDSEILKLSRQQNYAHNLLELVREWIDVSGFWGDATVDCWAGTPTKLLNEIAFVDSLKEAARKWDAPKVFRCLDTLARLPGTGVDRVPGPDRTFTINRKAATA